MADLKITELPEQTAAPADDDVLAVDDISGTPTTKKITPVNLVENNAKVLANTAHISSDGKDHSDVVLNNTHRISDGKDHSDVVLNNTHRTSDGKDHSDVVLNNSHRSGNGSDHSDVAANTTHAGLTNNPHAVTAVQAGAAPTVHTHLEADITDLDHTDADAIHDNVAAEISAITQKVTPIGADHLLIEDSADSDNKKRVLISSLPSSSPVFGTQYAQIESNGTSTTALTALQQKVRLTTGSLPAGGTYRIGYSFLFEADTEQTNVDFQVEVDDLTNIMNMNDVRVGQKAQDGWTNVGAFKTIALASGTHTVDIDFRAVSGGPTVSIKEARIEFWRVS